MNGRHSIASVNECLEADCDCDWARAKSLKASTRIETYKFMSWAVKPLEKTGICVIDK